MRAFLEQYGIAIFTIIIISFMTLMSNGLTMDLKNIINFEIKNFISVASEEPYMDYDIIEGADQVYYAGELRFRSDANYEKFDRVEVDGEVVDPSNYTAYSGSTIIVFTDEFAEKLALGEHEVKIISTNGEADCDFYVEDPLSKLKNPKPGVYELTANIKLKDRFFFQNYTATEGYVFNGNGKQVETFATEMANFNWNVFVPGMSNIFGSAKNAPVVVNDLKLTGEMSSVMAGFYDGVNIGTHNTVFNNVDILNVKAVSFSADTAPALTAYGKVDLNNCNIYGTTRSELDDAMWPIYDLAVPTKSKTTINGGKVGAICTWTSMKLTLNNTKVDSIFIKGNMGTGSSYGIYINEGTTVGYIDLSKITNVSKVKIIIAEGATVGKIIANGVEYDSIDDWKESFN